jgi:hypothetical protein
VASIKWRTNARGGKTEPLKQSDAENGIIRPPHTPDQYRHWVYQLTLSGRDAVS